MGNRIFYGGNVYVDRENFAQAILIEDGIIRAVGTDEEILAMATEDTDRINLNGQTVVPGFNDSHMHLAELGEMRSTLMLQGTTSVDDVVARGREYIEKNNIPAGTPIIAMGWNQDFFEDEAERVALTRHDLDRISTEHPIVAIRVCVHIATANSAALERLGFDRNSTDIDGGSMDRDENGELTGVFRENAMQQLMAIQSEITTEQAMEIIKSTMAYANSNGITSIQPNDVKDTNADVILSAYQNLRDSGQSTVRVYQQCCFTNKTGLTNFLDKGYRTGDGDDMNRIGPVKLFIDGSLGARTALMRNDYHDDPGNRGIATYTQEQLDEMIRTADEAGMQVAVHAIGDGAIERVLNSYSKVIENGQNDHRHGIVHCQITDIPMLERFKEMDIFAYLQPIFLNYDTKIADDRVGKELASTSYAFATMEKMGIHNGYGTDAPVEDLNPLENIHCAVNRTNLSNIPEGGFYENECVDIYTAIDKYTVGSAYASFEEDVKGRIKEGYYGDLTVLDRNIFEIPSLEIKNVGVNMTVLGGEIVFSKD